MTTAARLLWTAAAGTEQRREIESRLTRAAGGPCWLCGQPCDGYGGVDAQSTVADTWTNADWVESPRARWLCAPCALSIGQNLPWPGRDRPQRMQNYSHLVVGGRWHAMTKSDQSPAVDVLLHPPSGPWFLGLTTTGQKHMIFRTPVNHGGNRWYVRFEEQVVSCDTRLFSWLLSEALALYEVGLTKEAILTGSPSPGMLVRPGAMEAWGARSIVLAPYIRGAALALAVFLMRKNEHGRNDET